MNSVENGRKSPLLFSIFIFEYEHESGNDIAGNEIENELSKFRKRTFGVSKTNQFDWNYIEHGRYTKIQYEIPTHSP